MSSSIPYNGNPYLNTNELSPRYGDWIGSPDPKPKNKIEYIYFTYIRIQNNNRQHLYVRQYYEKLTDVHASGNIIKIERELMLNARKSEIIRRHQPVGQNFSDMAFVDEDCYFTVVIDERDWRFNPESTNVSQLDEFIVFRENKIEVDSGNYVLRQFDSNDAFYGLTRNPIRDPFDGTKRDCIRCVFRSAGPYWDKDEKIIKQYGLDIYIKAPFYNNGAIPENWLTVIFDPKVPSEGPPKQKLVSL